MAIGHNNSSATNGLLMCYDIANTKKSWRGAPVTNYIPFPAASHNGSSFVNFGYNYANLGVTYTYGAGVSNPVNAAGVLQYFTGTTGYKYFSVDSTTLPTTGTYTFSYYARMTVGGAANNIGNSQLWRAAGSDRAVTGNWNPTFTSEWVRYSTSGPAEAGTILQYFPVHSGSITGGYTIEYCGFQLELGSYATPFVEGTRSASQAIVDLTSNYTLTATSLTYPIDNTFSFNGSSSVVASPSTTLNLTSGVSMEMVFRSTDIQSRAQGYMSFSPAPQYINFFSPGNSTIRWETWQNAGSVGGAFFSPATLTNNTWYHAVGTYSSSTGVSVLYINGVQVNTATYSAFSYGNLTSTIRIGEYSGYLSGNIPISKMYSRALTANEVRQNFAAYAGRFGL
jgi:hypothetical protein